MKYDIITIGSAILDIYLRSSEFKKIPSGEFEGGVALCESFGGKTEVRDVELTTGGGGSNNAVSYARKGYKVAIICELGKDLIGYTVKQELKREGVDLSLVIEEPDEETGLSSIMVSDDGGRAVSVFRGASKMLTESDIKWDQLDTSWLHISSLGGQIELLEKLIDFAKEKNIKAVLNPGKLEIEAIKKLNNPQTILSKLETLLVNKAEAELLTGIKFSDQSVWESDHCIIGPKICVITDGANGGKVCVKGECEWYESSEVKVVESTGAGDAFGTGFVSALIDQKDIVSAISWGKKQAESVIQHMGPKKGLLTKQQLTSS